MITRLQTIFLKHNKWLFGGLLIVIIVTFVLTIGPQSFFGGSGPQKARTLNYYGYDLASESDQRAMAMAAEISGILNPRLQLRNDQLTNYAYMRVTALGLANQLGIPGPTDEALTDYIETLAIFQNPQTGEFSAESYNMMMNALETSSRYSRGSIAQVMREDYRILKVRESLGGPDYSLPFELQNDFIDRQTNYTVQLAHFDYEGFEPVIEPSVEDLEQFFLENPDRYEIPETLTVSALHFRADAYLDEVADPTEAELMGYFTANKASYEEDAASTADDSDSESESEEEIETPELTLADVRDTVIADWKLVQGRQIAARKSETFSIRLWQESIELDSPEFNSMMEEYMVQTVEIPPYSRNLPPQLPEANAQLLNSMWVYANNPTRYFSDISETAEGAVILVSRGLTEARKQDFWEVEGPVTLAYNASEKRRLFSEKGVELRETIKSRLDTESFEEVATSLNLEIESLEPFTGATPAQPLLSSSLWDQTRYLDSGEISPMALQANRGSFAYMVEKTVPVVDPESAEYQEYLALRSGALSESQGWSRLREISDQSLEALLGAPLN